MSEVNVDSVKTETLEVGNHPRFTGGSETDNENVQLLPAGASQAEIVAAIQDTQKRLADVQGVALDLPAE
jgi:hypothetical protein